MKHQAKISGMIRHVLTTAGGVLVALGAVESDQIVIFNNALDATLAAVGPLIGAASIIAGAAWSWLSRDKFVGNGDY